MAEEDIVYLLMSVVGILITLIVPLPLKEEYRLFIITVIIFIVLLIVLSKFNNRINEIEIKLEEVNKRFKTIQELEEIRLDLKELKKEVFK